MTAEVFRVESAVGAAGRATCAALVELLAESFSKDPFYAHIMREPVARPELLRWWMGVFLRNGLLSGEVLATGTPAEPTGAAIWLGPEKPVPASVRVARMGLIKAPFRLGPTGFFRMMKVTDHWQGLHRREVRPHWYLNFLGVSPAQQGRGLGSALVRAMTARADQTGLNCYLETCTETNVRIYERLGFKTVEQRAWTEGESPWSSWTMRRLPVGPT